MNKAVFGTALCILFLGRGLQAQQKTVSGIDFECKIQETEVLITVKAPTTGWVGVGFNSQNSIVGSDLRLFHIIDGKSEATDLYVKAAGDPRKDNTLGGTYDMTILKAQETKKSTLIQFSIPLDSNDPYDFKHEPGKAFWLILAYSVSDDFEHHSRVRKHIPFTIGGE